MNKTRLCKNCGKPLVMRPDETCARFAQRIYCGSKNRYRKSKDVKRRNSRARKRTHLW